MHPSRGLLKKGYESLFDVMLSGLMLISGGFTSITTIYPIFELTLLVAHVKKNQIQFEHFLLTLFYLF